MSFSSLMIRYLFAKGDRERDKDQKLPDTVEQIKNISYGPYGKENKLDLFYPTGNKEKLPVIVSFHGGAWVYGSKELYQYYCASLAKQGFIVVDFNYRLAPKHKYPAPLEDVNRVIEWLHTQGEAGNMDLSRIYMVGDSAGAHMLTLYTCICTNQAYAALYDFTVPHHFVPTAVALNCGVYDIYKEIADNEKQSKAMMNDFLGKKNQEELLKKVNAIDYITKEFPPTFLMSATGDFLKEQLPVMEKRLTELGVDHVSHIYGEDGTALGHVFHCDMRLQEAAVCNQEECEFFLAK